MTIDELMTLHESTCQEARDIMRAKNHDYTSGSKDPFANFRASEAMGVAPIVGILVRSIDKFQRIRSFVEQGELKVAGEPVDDAIRDVINYMILARGLAKDGATQ
jgi:hypothetical protein